MRGLATKLPKQRSTRIRVHSGEVVSLCGDSYWLKERDLD
jgi:hypothetical protein